MILEKESIAVITEIQLFGEQTLQQRRRTKTTKATANIIRDLSELSINSPVVHSEHGVGRYLGLQIMTAGGETNEYLILEYAGEDKLYIPVSALHLISRFTGPDPEHAPLHRLGSNQWQKAKRKAAEKVRDVAAELLAIYAKREAEHGTSYPIPDLDYQAFANEFPFETTPDQQQAIEAVLNDMSSSNKMDRLVCGDVGFGKTEVAMRGAFIAAQNSSQVAVLVPTTLLAQQHYTNFCDRFANLPIKVAILSRFQTNKEKQQTLAAIESGQADIIIGTHKLLQKDVKFAKLGLLIIDEEHRFGVRQKDKFKALRSEVDILTLTATPIPRTLNISLSGLRDLSIIATPPENRVAIKTFVREWDDQLIREAVLRELRRGGQIYFLHNKVENIQSIADEISQLLPEAAVATAHGQMPERELEQVMLDFYHNRCNVLICTTIIESGIDIPSANTIIINRADRLGLAQLYQLRGRVGRSHHSSYAYLLTPPKQLVNSDAKKRLEAIESLEELGAGFTLAMHDLEIRGAGELLGDGQSGHIQEIGFNLYNKMLEQAVNDLKQGKAIDLEQEQIQQTEVDLNSPALITDDYLPDVNSRLVLYKRIADAADSNELDELQVEMIDRFGLLPEQTKTLFAETKIKLLATPLGIIKFELNEVGGNIEFNQNANIDPGKLIAMVQANEKQFSFAGPTKLKITTELENLEEKTKLANNFLSNLNTDN